MPIHKFKLGNGRVVYYDTEKNKLSFADETADEDTRTHGDDDVDRRYDELQKIKNIAIKN